MVNYERLNKSIKTISENIAKLYDITNGNSGDFPDLYNANDDDLLGLFIGTLSDQTESEVSLLKHYGFDEYGFDSHDRIILSAFIKNIYNYKVLLEKGIRNTNISRASFNSPFYQLDYSNKNVIAMIDNVYKNILGVSTLYEISRNTRTSPVISNALLIKTLVSGFNISRSQVVSSQYKFSYYPETVSGNTTQAEVVYFANNTEFYNCQIDLPVGKIALTGCKFVNCTFTGDTSCVIYIHDNNAKEKIFNMFIGGTPNAQFKDRFENLITIL